MLELIIVFILGAIVAWLALKPYYRLKIKEGVEKAVDTAKKQFEAMSLLHFIPSSTFFASDFLYTLLILSSVNVCDR